MGCALASASADAAFKAVDVGVQGASVSGVKSQSYGGKVGMNFATYLKQPDIHNNASLMGAVDYQSFDITGFTNGNLHLLDVTLGLEMHGNAAWGISPRAAVLAGMTYAWLGYAAGTSSTQNSKGYFTAKFSPGFDFAIFGPLALGVRMPVQFVFAKPVLTMFSQSVVVRWSL